jgi:hypothetical protein
MTVRRCARTIGAAGLALFAAGAMTCGTATSASAAPRPGPLPFPVPDVSGLLPGLYAVNVHNDQCLVARDGSGPAAQRHCAAGAAYRWKLVPVSLDGRFRVQNEASGQCLSPIGATGLAAETCSDDVARTWRLRDAPGAGIYVIDAADGQCLTAGVGGSAVRNRCDGDVSRRWSFREVPDGPGVVTVNGGRP